MLVFTLTEAKAEMRAQGYTHYLAYDGPHPIEDFDPYGMVRNGSERQWRGELFDMGMLRDYANENDKLRGFYEGLWTFIRQVEAKPA
jgi:hypothetical protein